MHVDDTVVCRLDAEVARLLLWCPTKLVPVFQADTCTADRRSQTGRRTRATVEASKISPALVVQTTQMRRPLIKGHQTVFTGRHTLVWKSPLVAVLCICPRLQISRRR